MSPRQDPAQVRARGQHQLLAIVGFFLLPFAAATLLYFGGWRPSNGAQGMLARELPAQLSYAGLQPLNGAGGSDRLGGHWVIAVLSGTPCDNACKDDLDGVQRVHATAHKNSRRIRRLLVTAAPADAAAASVQRDLHYAVAAAPEWQALLPTSGHRVVLIDPAGRPVLRYPQPFDARNLQRDLERLLKYSWIG